MTICCSVRILVLCAVTLCYLWGCGSWVECWQTGAGGEVEVVRVGIILVKLSWSSDLEDKANKELSVCQQNLNKEFMNQSS